MAKTPTELRKLIEDFNKQHDYGLDEDDLIETLRDSEVDRVASGKARWWHQFKCVAAIGDVYIEWYDATADGDDSASDKGWVMNWGRLREVVPVEKTVTVFEPK